MPQSTQQSVTLAFATLIQESETMTFTSICKQAVAAIALTGACSVAQAVTKDIGPVSVGTPAPFSGSMIPGGTFLDVFTFSLPANGGSGYSVINFPLDIPGVGTFNTVFSTMTLVSNPDGILFNSDDLIVNSTVSAGADALSLTWGPSVGGSMYLTVGGITNGTLGGLYNGAISVAAVPVPEPSTWAMLGLGVGMIGFAIRRKMR